MSNNKIAFTLIVLFITSGYTAWSQNTKQCDSLIEKGIDLMWKKEHEKSLELLTKAKNTAEKNSWYKQYFKASNNIGGNYYLMLDYGEALNQYLESYKIAIAHLDESYEMIVLNNIAILYSKEKKLDKAQEYFLKAYDIAQKKNDFVKIGYYAVNLGSVLNERNKPLQAQKYIQEALVHLKKQPDILYLANIVQAENELLTGQLEQSRGRATELLNDTKNKFNADNQIALAIIIAKTYTKENNFTTALKWINKAMMEKPDAEKKIELFKLLSDIHFKQKNYELALHYKDSINIAQTNLNEIKNGSLFASSQIKFQLQNYKKEIAAKDIKIKNERYLYFSLLGIVILLLIFVSITYRNQKIKNKQCKLIADRNQQITLLKLQQVKDDNLLSKKKEEIAVLEQENLKREIELKNQKIAAKALYLSGKEQLLQEILKALNKIPELSKNKTLLSYIRELKGHLNTEDDWNNFMLHFEEVNQGLLQKLKAKHSGLTKNELRYISYEYMNLSTKEIAILLNITPDACRKRRERIINKLGLADDLNLINYLSNI